MGYSTNPAVLEDFLAEYSLDDMKLGLPCAWEVSGNQAQAFAYRLRQALYIAAANPELYPELAEAQRKYRVTVPTASRVEAIPSAVKAAKVSVVSERVATAVHGGDEPFGRPSPQVRLDSAASVQASWQQRGPSNDPLHIRAHQLSYNELVKLYAWCEAHVPKLMMFEAGGSLTVAVREAGAHPHSWHPTPEGKPEEKLEV